MICIKILIVSHNPVSTYNGMGKTICSFFSAFDKTEVCQFYIFPSYPDVDICSSYYRVTDKDVLRSFWNFKAPGGKVAEECIGGEPVVYECAGDERIYTDKRNKRPFRLLLRDVMWSCARWNNRKLKAWLEEECPDCIFLAPGGAKFIYDVALSISKNRHIPIITYIADEYYFVNPEKGFLGRIQHLLLRKKMEKTLTHSAHVITISKEFEYVYAQRFKRKTTTIMTGSNYPVSETGRLCEKFNGISYFGNIAYNRYVSLADIGHVLDEINRERKSDYKLDIYSAQNDKSAMQIFEGITAIRWKGFISGQIYNEKFFSSGLLLHTEAFDEKNTDLVKYSVSTKIADSLASGIPLLAYGPENISSMKHLIRNKCALIATSKEELRPVLEKALFDREARLQTVKNAVRTAALYHDKERNSFRLRSIFSEIEGVDQ